MRRNSKPIMNAGCITGSPVVHIPRRILRASEYTTSEISYEASSDGAASRLDGDSHVCPDRSPRSHDQGRLREGKGPEVGREGWQGRQGCLREEVSSSHKTLRARWRRRARFVSIALQERLSSSRAGCVRRLVTSKRLCQVGKR